MKKKIVLIGLVAVCIVLGVLCYKAWFAAFFITKFLSGRRAGHQGIVRSVIIPWRSYHLHMHHWLLALVVGGVFLAKGFYLVTPQIFYGVLAAAVFQGIYCYEDWHHIIKRKVVLPVLKCDLPLLSPDETPEAGVCAASG
ncbi:MAG: hypothetical protein ACNA7X_03130 [Dehalococcoidia bacterium]